MWFLAFILLLASNSVGVTGSLSPLPSNVDKSTVVEGSGNDKLDRIRQVVGVDTEIHGSGNYGSDDEDSQLHQGSGDIVEGSGNVDGVREVVHEHPVVFMTTTTTTTHSPAIISETRHEIGVINEEHPSPILETPIKTITSEVPSETVPTTVPTTTSRRPPITAVPPAVNPGDSENTPFHHMLKPGIFAAVIGGMVVGLLTAILLVMFIVYRMRKKDEGSYALEEPKSRPYTGYAYTKASTKEFYA